MDGKKEIGRKLKVDYKDEEGEYLGWFAGTIAAYNKRQGFFINFDAATVNGQKYEKWSDWLEELDSDDVILF